MARSHSSIDAQAVTARPRTARHLRAMAVLAVASIGLLAGGATSLSLAADDEAPVPVGLREIKSGMTLDEARKALEAAGYTLTRDARGFYYYTTSAMPGVTEATILLGNIGPKESAALLVGEQLTGPGGEGIYGIWAAELAKRYGNSGVPYVFEEGTTGVTYCHSRNIAVALRKGGEAFLRMVTWQPGGYPECAGVPAVATSEALLYKSAPKQVK